MAVVNSIVINDGQATPVPHTFLRMPSTAANIVAFRDNLPAVPASARASLTGQYRPAAANNDGAKRVFTLNYPKYDNALKKVLAVGRIKIEILVPDLFDSTDTANMQAYATNFVNNADVKAEIKDGNVIV